MDAFDNIDGFEGSDVKNMFELSFYQDTNQWKQKIASTELSKNVSDKAIALMLKKNQYDLNRKLYVFLGKHDSNLFCRRHLSSYSIENVLKKQEKLWATHLLEKIFHKIPLFFRTYADFEFIAEKCNSSIGDEATNI